jgi:MerR family copper efflux transcriptional regulator
MKMRDLRIGEAANRSGVSPKTIRFYEEAGIIKRAARGENHYRTYGEADIQTLRFIQRARALGFPLKDISKLLELYRNGRRASSAVKNLALEHVAELDRKIAEMTAIQNAIAALSDRCHGNDRPECPILDELGSAAR